MTFQAKVIYEFEAVGEGELTVRVGDIVTVTNTDVGQGWLFGVGVDGKEGIVPEAYVERIPDASYVPSRQTSKTDTWDDEWDSDEEDKSNETSTIQVVNPSAAEVRKVSPDTGSRQGSVEPGFSLGKLTNAFGKSDTVSDYLMGMTETAATVAKEAIFINEPNHGYFQWETHSEPFTCIIGAPKKSSKFGGMKSFIAYQVTPSFSNIQVSRRYKHFDWLHERLVGKFGMIIAIPPLPEKQVTGRFEEELIEHRRVQLQSFANRICRHPVLSNSEVWKHFLIQTDEKKWTQGKRKAEADPNVGISFLTTIQAPFVNAEMENILDEKIVNFSKNMTKMESAVKNMKSVANEQMSKYNVHSKDYTEIGKAFSQLGSAMQEEAPCLMNIGACYQEMSGMWDTQGTKDWEPVQHLMHDYKGLAGGWQGVLGLYGNMKEKQKEILKADGIEKEKDSAVARVNIHRIGVEAERTLFGEELGNDMTHISQMFLVEQINLHRQLADRLEKLYYDCWPGAAGEEQLLPNPQTLATSDAEPGLTDWD
eukprot:GFUD01094088.1.p1 GENE.GFUD01094088.1~~GFUD01094088.1.p1  ORF type:complete len:536 (+),score=138.48 GFUD01094088.1:167-1774(+)